MINYNLFFLIIACIILLFYFSGPITHNQFGGQDIISTNIIVEPDLIDNSRNFDYTDSNLTAFEINSIVNGVTNELAAANVNMYLTGKVIDGIGNYTVDGASRVETVKNQPKRLYMPNDNGKIIEADTQSMIDLRPRSNDRAFKIMHS